MVLRNGAYVMKKVLVAVDGSDKSLEAADYAMSIANKERAQLIILNVLDTEGVPFEVTKAFKVTYIDPI